MSKFTCGSSSYADCVCLIAFAKHVHSRNFKLIKSKRFKRVVHFKFGVCCVDGGVGTVHLANVIVLVALIER